MLGVVERMSATAFGALVAAGVAVPLAATWVAAGVLDAVLVGGAVGWGAAGGALGWYRRRVSRLPLELAGTALMGRVNGAMVYRFRARLGHGRRLSGATGRVRYCRAGAEPVVLPVLAVPSHTLLGPWTVVASDPTRVCLAPGHLEVRVSARAGTREWCVERRYAVAEVRSGWFAGPVRPVRGRLRWDDGAWDRVAGSERA